MRDRFIHGYFGVDYRMITMFPELAVAPMAIKSFCLTEEDKQCGFGIVAEALSGFDEVAFGYLHGSFLEAGPFRDLDIAVFVDPDRLKLLGDVFAFEIEAAVGNAWACPFPIDVRVLNTAPIPFQYHAIRGRLLVDRNPELRIDFVGRAISRYLDMKPILRHHASAMGGMMGALDGRTAGRYY